MQIRKTIFSKELCITSIVFLVNSGGGISILGMKEEVTQENGKRWYALRVISGKDKGKEGTIKQTLAKKNRVVVEGLNMIKKHQKPNNANPQGGILDVEAPMDVSNVMLIDPKTSKPTRVGYKIENGKKLRIAKKSGTVL